MNALAIVGSHSGTRALAPFDDPDFDIWAFNEAPQADWCRRVDGAFQMHLPAIYRSPNNVNNKDHWAWLRQMHGFPIWMQERDDYVPDSVKYPLEQIVNELLHGFTVEDARPKFFTSTAAYAMALAIFKGYEEIHLYGVELASNTEYFTQQAGFTFWTGLALGRGINVIAHCAGGMFIQPLYGIDGYLDYDPAEMQTRADGYLAEINTITAALEPYNVDKFDNFGVYGDRVQQIAYLTGRLGEVQRYQSQVSEMLERHGKAIIDRSVFEITASRQLELISTHGAMATRTLGWIDYTLAAYQQSRHVKAAKDQLNDAIKQHLEHRRIYGSAMGVHDENKSMMDRHDERIKAAGGTRAAQTLGV